MSGKNNLFRANRAFYYLLGPFKVYRPILVSTIGLGTTRGSLDFNLIFIKFFIWA